MFVFQLFEPLYLWAQPTFKIY